MNRRSFLITVPLCGMALACSPAATPHAADATYAEIAASRPPRKTSAPTILVFMPRTTQTLEVWAGLRDELSRDYTVVAVEVSSRDASSVIAEGVRRHRPTAVVLMNNPTLAAYSEYQRLSGETTFPPAVLVMTSFLEHRPAQIKAATGISYEVPLITVVTNLRQLIAAPIDRIGVIVRRPLQGFVEQQATLAARERITLIQEEVSAEANCSELKRAVRRLKQRTDALWILNDDHLLTPRLIAEGWLPGLNEHPWIPSIVGVGSLVSPRQTFGTFAVLPDHTALGAQVASMLLDLAENGWSLAEDASIQLPLSTTTTIDLVQARERFVLRADALQKVDRVLQ